MKQTMKIAALAAGILILALLAYQFTQDTASDSTSTTIPKDTQPTTPTNKSVFTLIDLMGDKHRLADYEGNPVLIHFMAVSCGGEYIKLNDDQLKQLKTICTELCEQDKIAIFTVLVSTCETTDLFQLYTMYNITWIMGNDYQDNKLDIIEKYSAYEPSDGMVLLLDEDLIVIDVFKDTLSSDAVIEKVLQLGE